MFRRTRGGTAALALVVALTTVAAACASNTGQKVAPTTAPAQTAQAQQPPTAVAAATEARPAQPKSPTVFNVGDTIKVQDHVLSVLAVRRDAARVSIDLQINNTGSREIAVSALASFAAKDTAGEKLGYAFGANAGQLDGKVPPNDKLKGTLTYNVPPDATGLKLYYTPSLLGQGAIVVALDDDAAKAPFPRPSAIAQTLAFKKGATFATGDAIQNKGVVARLEHAQVDGTLLNASVLIYNGGDRDVNVSSLVSFDARDSEGTRGKYRLEPDSPQLDGKLVPGDTLEGKLAWEFAAPPSGVKVYFTDSLFSGDTIVWSVD